MRAQQVTSTMINYFQEIRKQYDKYVDDIKYHDKVHVDLSHALELLNFNASGGYKLAKEFQDNLKKRREAKDLLQEIEPLYQLFKRNDRFLKEIKTVNTDVMKINQSQKNRKYRVRARTDMQEAFDKANMR